MLYVAPELARLAPGARELVPSAVLYAPARADVAMPMNIAVPTGSSVGVDSQYLFAVLASTHTAVSTVPVMVPFVIDATRLPPDSAILALFRVVLSVADIALVRVTTLQ